MLRSNSFKRTNHSPQRRLPSDTGTGVGKTSMTAAIALSYEEAADYRSIIIVPDRYLTTQTFDEYKNFTLDVGMYTGKVKDGDHMHIVSTWQTLQNHKSFLQQFKVVVVDECHGLKGPVLKELLLESGKNIPFRFGVTGTLPKGKVDKMSVTHRAVADALALNRLSA